MKLYVALTPGGMACAQALMEQGDTLLHDSGLSVPAVSARGVVKAVPAAPVELERTFCQQYAAALEASSLPAATLGRLRSYANNFSAYVFRPLLALVAAVETELATGRFEEIVVLTPEGNGVFPFFLMQTLESGRGSALLLPRYLAAKLLGMHFSVPVRGMATRERDVWLKNGLRRFLLTSISLLASLFFLAKLVLLHIMTRGGAAPGGMVILCRARHHVRFALTLLRHMPRGSAKVLLIPQFMQDGLGSLRFFRTQLKGYPVVLPGIWQSLCVLAVEHLNALRAQPSGGIYTFEVVGQRFQVSEKEMLEEIVRLPVINSYERLLGSCLAAWPGAPVLSFELVGRNAGMDFEACRSTGARLFTLQTASVAARPHVIFPMSPLFFADAPQTAEALSTVGCMRYGRVCFAGTPFEMRTNRSAEGGSRVIGFFTQPYEPMVTAEILRALQRICADSSISLSVRLHPRDKLDAYPEDVQAIIRSSLSASLDAGEMLDAVDYVVTRTSSVAKEAMARGIPTIVCPLSEFEQAFSADYMTPLPDGWSHVCTRVDQLAAQFSPPYSQAIARAQSLHRVLFGDARLESLVAAMLQGDA